MAAPTYESFAINDTRDAATCNVSVPSGSGELLLAFLCVGRSGNIDLHADWNDSGLGAFQADSDDAEGRILWRLRAGAAASYTFTRTGDTAAWIASIVSVDGADTTTPFAATSSVNQGNSTSPSCPNVNSGADDALVFRFYAASNADSGAEDTGYPTDHTGIYNRCNEAGSNANEVTSGVAYETQATQGNTGSASFTQAGGNDDSWGAVTVTIQPGAGEPPAGGGLVSRPLLLMGVGA